MKWLLRVWRCCGSCVIPTEVSQKQLVFVLHCHAVRHA